MAVEQDQRIVDFLEYREHRRRTPLSLRIQRGVEYASYGAVALGLGIGAAVAANYLPTNDFADGVYNAMRLTRIGGGLPVPPLSDIRDFIHSSASLTAGAFGVGVGGSLIAGVRGR